MGRGASFYLSPNNTFDAGDVLLGSHPVPALEPGQSETVSTELSILVDTAAGSYFIIAVADADNVVVEGLERNNADNNTSTTNNRLSINVVHGPDLLVSALSVAVSGSTVRDGLAFPGQGANQ